MNHIATDEQVIESIKAMTVHRLTSDFTALCGIEASEENPVMTAFAGSDVTCIECGVKGIALALAGQEV